MPTNLGRKVRRKNQVRLAFEPVNQSSSPAKGKMSPAKVRYSLRDSKQTPASRTHTLGNGYESEDILSSDKKSIMNKTPAKAKNNGKLPFKPLPTPAKSSQPQIKAGASNDLDDSEDETDNGTYPSSHTLRSSSNITSSLQSRGKQTAISFNDAGDSSDGSPPEEEVGTPAGKKKKVNGKPAKPELISLDSEDEATAENFATTKSNKGKAILPNRTTRGCTKTKQTHITLSDDSSDQMPLPRSRPKQRSRGFIGSSRKSSRLSAFSDDEDSDDIVTTSPPKRRQRKIIQPHEDEDEDDDEPINSSRPRRQPNAQDLEDDSDDPIISPLKRQRPIAESDDSDMVSSPLKRRRPALESDDSDVVSTPLKRTRKTQLEMDDSSDSDDLPSPSKIPSKRDSATPTRHTRQAKTRRHRTEREKTMELLKRKRAGEDIEELTETSESEEGDSEQEFQELSNFEDESEEEAEEPVRKPARKKTGESGEDDSDSDFIVEDDEGALGVPDPALLDIPLQFTHAAHKPMKEHFKDAVEWMVHKKVNPAFVRNDPLYIQAFKKLDDEYGGYAKSKFISSQWTNAFTKAITARPTMEVRQLALGEGIDMLRETKCDVCNHRKHPPKFEIKFSGKAYHKDSLEEVEQDSDESSGEDGDSDKGSVNTQGHRIPNEETRWLSGRFCKANADQAHALLHWKYALNEWVIGNLEAEGYLTPAKLAEREKMKSKRRRDFANNIVDGWESDGQIKALWRDFKINLETAREAKQGMWSGGNFRGYER